MNITQKLLTIQTELKAPKNQRNAFGKYNYRSAEDILEAVKPLAMKHEAVLKMTDEIKEVGGVLYIESTAKLIDAKDPSMQIESNAQAIIDFDAKGMQQPQRTGAASSYAKKYAIGNLLLIDDTKDADATNNHSKSSPGKPALLKGSPEHKKVVSYLDGGGNVAAVMQKYTINNDLLKDLKSLIK
jgi:hypothetical protein